MPTEDIMDLFERFQQLDIDFEAIGLMQSREPITYFCTPAGAEILGWAGVDGIHYCRIKTFGETVFAISPSNLVGEHMHPIARDFGELLSLLLACGSMDAIEQAWCMNRERFDAYLAENPPAKSATAAFETIQRELSIIPAKDPYQQIRSLQNRFDYSRIPFTEEYYETIGEDVPIPPPPPEWKVTFHGGLMPEKGRSGKEVWIGKTFRWGKELWHIPAAYLCTEGIVLDVLAEVEPERVAAFIEKWDLLREDEHAYTEEEQERIDSEHPLNLDFNASLLQDGKKLSNSHGCSTVWVPPACVEYRFPTETDAAQILAHYGFDDAKAWSIHRISFPWEEKCPKKIDFLQLILVQRAKQLPGSPFFAPHIGESIALQNPFTGQDHLLTIHEYAQGELDAERFASDPDTEYPLHFTTMVYTLFPESEPCACVIKDRGRGDSPRKKGDGGNLGGAVGVIGMMKRETGKEYSHPDGTPATARVACSSLRFKPAQATEWYPVFQEKQVEDFTIALL